MYNHKLLAKLRIEKAKKKREEESMEENTLRLQQLELAKEQ